MNFPLRNSARLPLPSLLLFQLILALLFLSGCAQKPWGDVFHEQEEQVYRQFYENMRQRQRQCPGCLDGDIKLFLTSPIGNRAGAGYFQLLLPAHIRFIASNPFGQPLLLFVSDGANFQYINTTDRLSLSGDVKGFLQTIDTPPALVSTSWGQWLTGRLPVTGTVEAVEKDRENRGGWITVTAPDPGEKKEHLLIRADGKKLLSRIISSKGKILLQIDYQLSDRPEDGNKCSRPEKVQITGLDYGTELTLEISNQGELSGCSPTDFTLSTPPGYLYREIAPEGE